MHLGVDGCFFRSEGLRDLGRVEGGAAEIEILRYSLRRHCVMWCRLRVRQGLSRPSVLSKVYVGYGDCVRRLFEGGYIS